MMQHCCYPLTCALCGAPGEVGLDLCRRCRAELPENATACARCALPLPAGASAVCGQCQRRAPPFDHALSPFRYDAPLDHLIHAVKFHARLNVAHLLGTLMADHLATILSLDQHAAPELLIPVPLHRSRLRERGFNQALELTRPIAHRLRIPIDFTSCRRIRATPAQALVAAKARRRNVKGAFEVARYIEARHVALVDDVMTTGHTVGELAVTLCRAGVETVTVWACARAGHA